jgi:hypothetical protein
MKHYRGLIVWIWLAMAWLCCSSPAVAQVGSAFTFQGQLEDANAPANGTYDFQFYLYSSDTGGVPFAGNVQERTLEVIDGVFSTELDFPGGPFDGQNRWLEVRVRLAGQGGYTTLSPRQRISATPYAQNAATVAANGVNEAALAEGIVTDTKVDSSTVQLRVTEQCAAGSSIRRIFEDGTVTCEPDDAGGGGLWMTGENSDILSTQPVRVETDSTVGVPTLSLVETQNDYVRLRFRNTVNADRNWTFAAYLGAAVTDDHINFFNPGAGNVLSLTGKGWVGVGTDSPVSPLMVQGDDLWRPVSGNGFGDFHIGNNVVGLSIGVALGGGGAGSTRFWTNNSQPIFLGNADNDMLLGIGTNGGTDLTLLSYTHSSSRNRVLEVDQAGNVVGDARLDPATLFGQFGGDGSDGDLIIANGTTVNLGTTNGVYRRQYSNLVFEGTGTLHFNSMFTYIAVSGVCVVGSNAKINADGSGMWGGSGGSGTGDSGVNGQSGRLYSEMCVSGSGGNGGSTAFASGGEGGSAGGFGGSATDPIKLAVLLGGVNNLTLYDSGDRVSTIFPQLLYCPGGGGGGGAAGSQPSSTGGQGGPGGGVLYIECNRTEGNGGVFSAGGLGPVSGPTGDGATGGGGGGGVVIVRTKTNSGLKNLSANGGGTTRKGANGYAAFTTIHN